MLPPQQGDTQERSDYELALGVVIRGHSIASDVIDHMTSLFPI